MNNFNIWILLTSHLGNVSFKGSRICDNSQWMMRPFACIRTFIPSPYSYSFPAVLEFMDYKAIHPDTRLIQQNFPKNTQMRCLRKHTLDNGRSFLLFCWHSAKFYKELKLQWLLKKEEMDFLIHKYMVICQIGARRDNTEYIY